VPLCSVDNARVITRLRMGGTTLWAYEVRSLARRLTPAEATLLAWPDKLEPVKCFDMNSLGPKLGWWLGGVGSLLWLPIMSVIWLVQGNAGGAALGLLLTGAGIAYLVLLAPWRFPQTPIRWLFLGFVLILLAGAAVAIWQYRQALSAGGAASLVVFWTLFLPVFTLGKRSWSDLHGRGG